MRTSKNGVILWEVLWAVTVILVLLVTTQIALTRYWTQRLNRLDEKRERYDGELRFGTSAPGETQ